MPSVDNIVFMGMGEPLDNPDALCLVFFLFFFFLLFFFQPVWVLCLWAWASPSITLTHFAWFVFFFLLFFFCFFFSFFSACLGFVSMVMGDVWYFFFSSFPLSFFFHSCLGFVYMVMGDALCLVFFLFFFFSLFFFHSCLGFVSMLMGEPLDNPDALCLVFLFSFSFFFFFFFFFFSFLSGLCVYGHGRGSQQPIIYNIIITIISIIRIQP